MNTPQDSIITKHLPSLIDELERKLAYPKNDWRRKQQLQSELAEAKQRLESLQLNNWKKTFSDRTSSRYSQQPQIQSRSEELMPKSSHPQKFEINYC